MKNKEMVATLAILMLGWAGVTMGYAQDTLAKAKQTGKLTIGIANDPPWAFVDAKGNVTGQAPDVLKAALAPLGITKVEAVVTEFGALIPALQSGRFDVIASGLYITPVRCKQVAFGNPDLRMGEGFLVLKGNPKSIHSFNDVAQKSNVILGASRGSAEVQYALDAGVPKDRLLLFPDEPSLLSALLAGRIDAVSLTAVTISKLLAASDKVERVEPFSQPVDAKGKAVSGYPGLAFRKEDSDLRDAYNVELKKLRESGKLLEILKAYGYSDDELPPAEVTAAELCK
ncbi:ectoine/hydroxyectoine ABC transporter substrate-binding protein EhuB [Mesorhizobium sp. SARCC-RB16n]|uniref:ectoine/hydroxyectoine ABC transporter substrate-binding protein EhuB n=1 Tax=Mesorhizobium sp. SARCC-RB16n TaxID=2116687 RepID=UPI001663D45E|nr:ectoine/hydroxyectoine ABC transporter substrate-binding protein EhuB [Mesorhizobium sp. SARCC-RB16n]